jgi:cytoskeleton protein RodZ
VAQRLHMSPSQVEALEIGEYERLPKGPFLRGFVRNYAKLVGLDPEGLLPLLAEGAPRESAPRIVVPTQNIRFDPLGQRFSGPWMRAAFTAVVVIALAFAAMYWWVFVRTEPPAQRQASADSAAVSTPAPAAAPAVPASPPSNAAPSSVPAMPSSAPQEAQASSAPGAASGSASSASKAETKPATAAASSPPPQASAPNTGASSAAAAPSKASDAKPAANVAAAKPAAGARRLHFRFKGESWVEVRDASGHVVFRQLNPAGSEASVDAKPPLQVVVGNAHEVEMQKDGKPFDLDPEADSDVARFTVE